MKQLIIGFILGSSISGALALGNPVANLPVQDQIDRIVFAVDKQFDIVSEGFNHVVEALEVIDRRLTALESK